ncbi:MAG: AAA family ATPase [Patescibacteria group bacterium]
MYLKRLELSGFKSFAKHTRLEFPAAITAIVGPNGSGKSNITEAIRWVLGEQSIKSLRGKKGEDLIFNGSQSAPRLGRGSASIFLDNKNKNLPIDYEEVKITRKVFRDGVNEYLINDSKVRHKDIVELLSSIGIGSSGHHIISQGEADRILNASLKERRQMIEDALGLKIYQIKKSEAERKLVKTEENMKQVESLRKEIQPHLRFLKKQAEKAEQVFSLKEKLKDFYCCYLAKEKKYLSSEKEKIEKEKNKAESEIKNLKKNISGTQEDSKTVEIKKKINLLKENLKQQEAGLNELRQKRNEVERDLGRLEGMIEAMAGRKEEDFSDAVSSSEVKNFIEKIEECIDQGMYARDAESAKIILSKIGAVIKEFSEKIKSGAGKDFDNKELEELRKKQLETQNLIKKIEEQELEIAKKCFNLKEKIEKEELGLREFEKEKYENEAKFKEMSRLMESIEIKESSLRIQNEEFLTEKREANAFVGEIFNPPAGGKEEIEIAENWLEERSGLRKEIERLKIRIEDSGGVGEDMLKEYQDVKKRDEFFAKELDDINKSVESLEDLLFELDGKINHDFKDGIEKINKELQEFFTAMFGGGRAELKVVASKRRAKKDEEIQVEVIENREDESEEGIEVIVSLPKKRITSLDMLSGGERALTSIALLFAMTQVNPPPFLVLDETDAALDEANSQKYGKMLKNLSKQTQLIIITHNRETMSQAGILYGVTMGSDSISRLLSIKFTEVEQYTDK